MEVSTNTQAESLQAIKTSLRHEWNNWIDTNNTYPNGVGRSKNHGPVICTVENIPDGNRLHAELRIIAVPKESPGAASIQVDFTLFNHPNKRLSVDKHGIAVFELNNVEKIGMQKPQPFPYFEDLNFYFVVYVFDETEKQVSQAIDPQPVKVRSSNYSQKKAAKPSTPVTRERKANKRQKIIHEDEHLLPGAQDPPTPTILSFNGAIATRPQGARVQKSHGDQPAQQQINVIQSTSTLVPRQADPFPRGNKRALTASFQQPSTDGNPLNCFFPLSSGTPCCSYCTL